MLPSVRRSAHAAVGAPVCACCRRCAGLRMLPSVRRSGGSNR